MPFFTPGKKLKILMVAPEIAPFSVVGGLSRVTAHLSKELQSLGHDVRLFMPKFGMVNEEKYPMEMVLEGLEVPTGSAEKDVLICNVKKYKDKSTPPVYFLENLEYYEKRANPYGYSDDPTRWALLSRGCLEFLKNFDWRPDVIHTNDWQTGSIPNYLRTVYKEDEELFPIAALFTIHNLHYQGMFDHRMLSETEFDDGHAPIAPFFSKRLTKQNFVRRGVMYADIVNTVSRTYAREILTEEYGEGLDRLLLEVRDKLTGVVNGIDYEEFNPATDKLVHQNYNISSLSRRTENKLALQEEFDLPPDPEIFLMGFVGRLSRQKGLDLVLEAFWPFLKDFEAQFIIIGGGQHRYVKKFKDLKKQYPKKVGTHLLPNFTLPRLVFSGADAMLMPSEFEPCGVVQLEAMRYGAIPIVRATGGLADTIEDLDVKEGTGTGFVFKDYDKWSLFAQLVRAFGAFKHKKIWQALQKRAMKKDFSWKHSAKEYVKLYEKALHKKAMELSEAGLAM